MPVHNWQHLISNVHLVLSSVSVHARSCSRTDMNISGMSFLLPLFSSPTKGERGGKNSNVELI